MVILEQRAEKMAKGSMEQREILKGSVKKGEIQEQEEKLTRNRELEK